MDEVKVTFVEPNGSSKGILAAAGITLMQAALDELTDGIVGECGGACMCATCHVYVADDWLDRLPSMNEMEESMLESVAAPRRPNSRLGCQIALTLDLDGLTVTVPERQI